MLRDNIRAEDSADTVNRNNEVSVHQDEEQLADLYGRSYMGLLGIGVYLAVSMIAFNFREQSLTGILTPELMYKLGAVPPVFMAVGLMWLSTLSALTIIIGRLYHGTTPSSTKTHVAFRIGFFLLFFVVGGLAQYINEIFISGLVVLTLQHYNVYDYHMQRIEKKFIIIQG